ncbi:MAG: DUF2075 domain-containing protein [Gammaproteobacteria bacterium]|nr:DUF2075 domain-containing protein [Gammaproteobacteria bacterium]MBU1447738.1 DUF2075 domain-containing protein [Gammaproteobacteria bacterium]
MLVYTSTKKEFLKEVRNDEIDEKILASFQRHLGHSTSKSEITSWRNSMQYMSQVLADDEIPGDSGVAIEYSLPQTTKRIDFILTGVGHNKYPIAIIIELKQWEHVKATSMDGIVRTFLGGAEREVSHPSYQAWTYAALLEDFNEAVQEESIGLQPCAYLHNCISEDVINAEFYEDHTKRAPAFLRKDARKLADFIKRYVKYGDSCDVMYRIEKGRIRPSKNLADKLLSLLKGNQEFLMIDDQKIAYETAISLAKRSTVKEKHVLVVEGGPGTGKSVVAINLLVALIKDHLLTQYVTKNSAPRAVYSSLLTGSFKRSHIDNLFKGSGVYTCAKSNEFDALIVDEAHRLNEKSGMFQNFGENQIKEIINAAKFSTFFIDEDQRVTFKDIGETNMIANWATQHGAQVHRLQLQSQFRCNGSDGYLSWIDGVLEIRETANKTLEGINYDFKVFDSPNELRDAIFEKNRLNNKARIVAGYCWDWISKKSPSEEDITLEEYKFSMKWNLASDGSLWILKPESVKEVGCIHTCQGLETDYIGVIVGPDFIIRDGVAITDAGMRAKTDASIKGYKSLLRADPVAAKRKADLIIKNTYRTLMTRGMKGCYIFCTDKETNLWFKEAMGRAASQFPSEVPMTASSGNFGEAVNDDRYEGLTLRLMPSSDVKPYINAVPIYDLAIAAGQFSETQVVEGEYGDGTENIEGFDWVELPDSFRIRPGQFVAKVIGESMNKRIPNGSWCLFNLNPVGSRQGKTVLVQHRNIEDPDTGGQYTVKVYESEKIQDESESWRHTKINLLPNSTDPTYRAIVLAPEEADELKVIAEFVAVVS